MNRYKTHYKPNPCGRTGFQSNYTTNLNDVTCISCLVKNHMVGAYNKKREKTIKGEIDMNDKKIKKKLKKLGIKRKDFLQITEAFFLLISMAKKYSEKQMKDAYDLLKEIMKD